MKKVSGLLLAAALGMGFGCQGGSPSDGGKRPSDGDKRPTAAKAEGEVMLRQTDYAGVMKAIAAHKGKVVVVDVWGEF